MIAYFPYLAAAWLFCIGLYGVMRSRHIVSLVMCVAVLQSSTYVLLLAIGYKTGGAAPVFADIPVGTPTVDPVVQALMLTDVVVEATVMALLLAIAIQIYKRTGVVDPNALASLKG